MFKKFLLIFSFLAILFFPAKTGAQYAASKPVDLYFFWGEGCPHCAAEEKFLAKIQPRYPSLKIHAFEVWKDSEGQKIFSEISKLLKLQQTGVPLTIVGLEAYTGYGTDADSGVAIEKMIQSCLVGECADVIGNFLKNRENPSVLPDNATGQSKTSDTVKVPFLGSLNVKNVSLPFLTLIIGLLDGFNPCAMWTLVFLVTLLLGMKNRRRMWILGGAFIFVSGFVYFLFMAAWLNLLLFIGFIFWIRTLIGVVALGSGIFNIREFFVNKNAVCKVEKSEERRNLFNRLKAITQRQNFWLALGGIILLAGAVNLVELVCSAGFPAIYTQVLTLNHLPWWQYYSYLAGYIFFYMLDDMLVFAGAMITLRLAGASHKYTRASYLVGGILMLIVGLLLIFKPGWLMFG